MKTNIYTRRVIRTVFPMTNTVFQRITAILTDINNHRIIILVYSIYYVPTYINMKKKNLPDVINKFYTTCTYYYTKPVRLILTRLLSASYKFYNDVASVFSIYRVRDTTWPAAYYTSIVPITVPSDLQQSAHGLAPHDNDINDINILYIGIKR